MRMAETKSNRRPRPPLGASPPAMSLATASLLASLLGGCGPRYEQASLLTAATIAEHGTARFAASKEATVQAAGAALTTLGYVVATEDLAGGTLSTQRRLLSRRMDSGRDGTWTVIEVSYEIRVAETQASPPGADGAAATVVEVVATPSVFRNGVDISADAVWRLDAQIRTWQQLFDLIEGRLGAAGHGPAQDGADGPAGAANAAANEGVSGMVIDRGAGTVRVGAVAQTVTMPRDWQIESAGAGRAFAVKQADPQAGINPTIELVVTPVADHYDVAALQQAAIQRAFRHLGEAGRPTEGPGEVSNHGLALEGEVVAGGTTHRVGIHYFSIDRGGYHLVASAACPAEPPDMAEGCAAAHRLVVDDLRGAPQTSLHSN